MNRFEPIGIEYYLLCLHFKDARPWRIPISTNRITTVMREVLADAGITSEPVMQQAKSRNDYYTINGLPVRLCTCHKPLNDGVVELLVKPRHHKRKCHRYNEALEHAWNSLSASKYGIDAPFTHASPLHAAYHGQMSLEYLGFSPDQAMELLDLDQDIAWQKRYWGIDEYEFSVLRNRYATMQQECWEWSVKYRQRFDLPLPACWCEILTHLIT